MSTPNAAKRPRLSVVVPLPDHRGHGVEAIRSWTKEQTHSPDEFEVVVIIDGREPEIEAAVAALLGPGDQLIQVPQASLHECYNAGAHAARGEILFFTESHVKAAPDCVEQMLSHFAKGGEDCVAVASGGIDEDRFAGQEQLIYEEALPGRIAGGWNLCTVRGFAVQRAAFEGAGGFASRYGHFSELLLGAALAHHGARLGYAPLARVWHFNSGTVQHFSRELNAFGRDEIRFRAEQPDSPLLEYLGPCPLWDQHADLSRAAAARRARRALWSSASALFGRKLKEAGKHIEEVCRFLPCSLLGAAWPRWKAAAGVQWAILWLYLCYPVDRWYYRAFRTMWNGQIRLGRAAAIEDLLARRREVRAPAARSVPAPLSRAA